MATSQPKQSVREVSGTVVAAAFGRCENNADRLIRFRIRVQNELGMPTAEVVDIFEYVSGTSVIGEGHPNAGKTMLDVREKSWALGGLRDEDPVEARIALAKSAIGRTVDVRWVPDTYVDRAGETVTKPKPEIKTLL